MKDYKNATGCFAELEKKYPDDKLTFAVKTFFSDTQDTSYSIYYKKSNDEEQKSIEIPEKNSATLNNYPNPFNPSTQINYQIPKDSYVKLIIYDVLGREVKTLVNEFRTTGKYNTAFDARNLASGTYFYRLIIKPSDGSKEIILNKSMQVVK